MISAFILLSCMFALVFLIGILFMPFWIRKARQIDLLWEDMNKFKSEKVAGSGGIIVVFSFIVGVFSFIAFRVFYLKSQDNLVEILALLLVIILVSGIGLIDDLLGWRRGGLSRRSRLALVLLAAIPLIAINAGKSMIGLPFIGEIDLGMLYPLIVIPIGIVGATTTFNFLAGFNGLEAGQGIILLTGFSIVSYFLDASWLAVIGICMIAALFSLLLFNFYPAKVFPGDTLTYAIGSLIAMMAILGNFEKIAVFFFIPYIIEVVLKSRGGLIKQSFGKPNKDGTLGLKYDKIYGLEHLSIYLMEKLSIKPTEKRVIYSIWTFQIIIIILGLIIFRKGIF